MNEDRYHTLWLRFCAGFIDLIVLAPFLVALLLLNPPRATLTWTNWLLVAAMVVVNTSYFVLMHARSGQTLGKKVMKVRVVDSTTEEAITLRQSWWRESPLLAINVALLVTESAVILAGGERAIAPLALLYLLLQYTPNLWAISDALTSLFNSRRRTLHDFIGRTVVVKCSP